eukprot:scaffold8.g1500.t1
MATDQRTRVENKAQRHIQELSSITLEDLQSPGFSPADLLARVGGSTLEQPSRKPAASRQPGQLSLSTAKALLERYERCDKELARLHQAVLLKAERLRREAVAQEGALAGRLGALQSAWEDARGGFSDLEARMNGVTQTAANVGNRLASADRHRQRALEAVAAITTLRAFARARQPADLPPLFHDDARMGEAAAMTGKLLALAAEIASSREQGGAPRPGSGGGRPPPELGSVEHALEQLELYRNLLDNRVVSRFDAALAAQNLPAMADCAATMARFPGGEALLVQRYISTRPIFKTWEGRVGAPGGGGGGAGSGAGGAPGGGNAAGGGGAALKGLSGLYKSVAATMRDEAVVMEQASCARAAWRGEAERRHRLGVRAAGPELRCPVARASPCASHASTRAPAQVFPSPYAALALFIQRLFEQKVQTAVDAVLPARPPRDAAPEALRARLQLLADVYKRTRGLAEELQARARDGGWWGAGGAGPGRRLTRGVRCAHALAPQELVGGEMTVAELADMVLAEPLSEYLPTELRWLSNLYDAKQRAHRAAQQQQQQQAQGSARGAAEAAGRQGPAGAAAPGGGQPPPARAPAAVGAAAAGSAGAGAGAAAPPGGGGGELSMPLVLDLLSMNEEAVRRCLLLSAPGQAAANVRQLFHSSTRRAANTGCLLEQVASHLIAGLGLATDACVKQLLGPFRPAAVLEAAAAGGGAAPPPPPGAAAPPPGPEAWALPPRAELLRAARLAASASVGRMLQAVTAAGAIAKALQQHHAAVVAPAVASHSGEARACLAGLAALVRAVEERVQGALQRALALLANQVDLTLAAAQQPSDFLPDEAAPPSLDAPTPACAAVVALVDAAAAEAGQHLHGPNRAAFCAELGRRLHRAVAGHMLRHAYSPMGGLRWRRDLAEYGGAAARAGAAAAAAALEELQGLSNLLVVAPDSLLGLADGNLRLSRRTALQYVALRADFRTARVGDEGATLAALFAAEA